MKSSIILIDKPAKMTSFSAVSRIRRLFGAKKAGHCGTLDPDATGLLPVMLGSAVKATPYLTNHDKDYTASIRLGVTTDTGDTGGKVISEYSGVLPGFDEFCAAAKAFTGEIMQMPPMYSALKLNGQKLVDLARKGIEVERSTRKITIYSIEPREDDGIFFIDVSCSRGTYIRTLCEDIGNLLGCGAAMASLRRTRVGEFTLDNAYTLEALKEMSTEAREACTIPVEDVFSRFCAVTLEPFYERLARNGAEIYLAKAHIKAKTGEMLRLFGADGFFALGEVREYPDGSAVKPVTMFM